ncbi:MAG: phosphatase PAP2 family protein [Ignavibacteriaceae bacterium]
MGALIFILIANAVSEGETNQFDLMILKSLRVQENLHQPIGPEWVDLAMRDITSLGGGTVIVIITVVVLGFLLLQKNYNAMWLILIATIGGALAGFGLKELMGRERPPVIFHLVYVNTLSFPSGHSMISAVVYLTQAFLLSRIQKKKSIRVYIISVALILTFLIGISRVYLGVHYPTDVLAGWSIGFTWALLCWFAVRYIQERKDKMKPIKNH